MNDRPILITKLYKIHPGYSTSRFPGADFCISQPTSSEDLNRSWHSFHKEALNTHTPSSQNTFTHFPHHPITCLLTSLLPALSSFHFSSPLSIICQHSALTFSSTKERSISPYQHYLLYPDLLHNPALQSHQDAMAIEAGSRGWRN